MNLTAIEKVKVSDHAKDVFRRANDAAYHNGYTQPMEITLRIADIRAIHAILSAKDE